MPKTKIKPEALIELRRQITSSVRTILKPRPDISGSEWANKYFYLAAETATNPGRFRWQVAPYQKEWIDSMCNDVDNKIVIQSSVRVGKTTCQKIAVGYFMHNQPSSVLVMLPTEQKAREWSQTECDPMLRDVPVLRELVRNKWSRDSGNTMLTKRYTGGVLHIVGAESHTRTHGITARVYVADECSRYPLSAGNDGDPIASAQNRVSSFGFRKKIILASTPGITGECPTERERLAGDCRYYFVKCPYKNCRHAQRLIWANLHYKEDPSHPEYMCESCAAMIPESYKLQMLTDGEWVPTNPDGQYRSYHISALYGNISWKELAQEWVAAQGNRFLLKPFINQKLGETWNEGESVASAHELSERLEDYNAPFPTKDLYCNGAGVVGVGVDVQKNYIFLSAIAAGANEEFWQIDQRIFDGDPGTDKPWNELSMYLLNQTFRTANGGRVGIRTVAIDSGYMTQAVHDFVAKFRKIDTGKRSIIATKGIEVRNTYIADRPDISPTTNASYFPIGTNIAKEYFTTLLKNKPSETLTKLFHLPRSFPSDDPSVVRWMDNELLEQLTSEKLSTKFKGSNGKKVWVQTRDRNEMFDTGILAIAAIRHLGFNVLLQLPAMVEACAQLKPTSMQPTQNVHPSVTPPRPGLRMHQPKSFWQR